MNGLYVNDLIHNLNIQIIRNNRNVIVLQMLHKNMHGYWLHIPDTKGGGVSARKILTTFSPLACNSRIVFILSVSTVYILLWRSQFD